MIIWQSSYDHMPILIWSCDDHHTPPSSLLLSVRSRDKCGRVQPWTFHPRHPLCKSVSLQCIVSVEGFLVLHCTHCTQCAMCNAHNALWTIYGCTPALLIYLQFRTFPLTHQTFALNPGQNQFNVLLDIARQIVEKEWFWTSLQSDIVPHMYSEPPIAKNEAPSPPHICGEDVQCKKAAKMQCCKMQGCALQTTPSRRNTNKYLQKPRTDFSRNQEQISREIEKRFLEKSRTDFWRNPEKISAEEKVFAPRSQLHVSPTTSALSTKCLFGINCLTLTLFLLMEVLLLDSNLEPVRHRDSETLHDQMNKVSASKKANVLGVHVHITLYRHCKIYAFFPKGSLKHCADAVTWSLLNEKCPMGSCCIYF